MWPALTHPYKHGSRRDLWISSNSHEGKRSASHVVPAQRRVDRSIGADRSGEAPEGFRQAPPPPVPMPISHFLVRPRRAAAVRTNAAIDASLRGDNVRRLISCLYDYSN